MAPVYALGPPAGSTHATLEPPAPEPEALEPLVPVKNLPAVIRTVQPGQQRAIPVTDIAEHDVKVAETLRQRLDFSEVIEGGARLSVRDAYAVLSPGDFARFEAISQAFTKRDGEQSSANTAALIVLGVAAAGALGMGLLSSVPVVGQLFIDVVGGFMAAMVSATIADAGTKSAKAAITSLTETLKALPAPDSGGPRSSEQAQ